MLIGLFKNASFGPPLNLHPCISLAEFYWFGQFLGGKISSMSIFFISSRCSCTVSDAPYSHFWCRDPKQCVLGFLKMLVFALPWIYTRVFHLWILVIWTVLGFKILPHINFLFSCVFLHFLRCGTLACLVTGNQTMFIWLFKDARFGPPLNLHTCISLVDFYWFSQCLGWRFSPMSIFLIYPVFLHA